jgi:outer membrane protein assembly factor BamD (BamD/ComL family)
MNKFYNCLLAATATILIFSCKPNIEKKEDNTIENIQNLERDLLGAAPNKPIDVSKANLLISNYMKVLQDVKTTENKEEYLFKAAELCNAVKRNQEAVTLFENFTKQFPNHRKAETALFLVGYIYENDMNQYGKATEAYNKFIETYPKSKLVKDAQFSINNMGKTPEQLISEFKQNEESSSKK